MTQRALAALPETVEERYFRGDAACYEQTLLKWLRNGKREKGPEGFIGFAVSARMSESLKAKIRLIPEAGWRPYREDTEVICECAELPWDPVERKAGEVLDEVRYLAIRVRRRQGVLFEDGVLTGLKRIALKPEYLRTPAQEAAISDLLLAGHAAPSRAATACAGRPAAGATAGVGGSLGSAAGHGLARKFHTPTSKKPPSEA